jgi:hypothetical protein
MQEHLTEKDLIEFQFKLAEEKRLMEIAGHLETCSKCKGLNEKLACKFSALNLLRTDEKAGEGLVARTIESASGGLRQAIKPRASFVHRNKWWMSAAAVFVLVITVAVVSQLNRKPTSQNEPIVAKETKGIQKRLIEKKDFTEERKLEQPAGGADISEQGVLDGQAGDEKPPFAPASAIELVVLPRRENVQITIYNSADLTLVREKRNLTLKKGWNWLQFMWANTLIDPTSLAIEPTKQKDKINIEQLVFPPRLRELGRWLIKSKVEGQVPFEITYFTSGLSWRAFYMGTLSEDERKMNLEGFVRVTNNSGEDYENAQTRLIVGNVHLLDRIAELARQQWPYGSPVRRYGGIGGRGEKDNVKLDLGEDKADTLRLFDDLAVNKEFEGRIKKPKEITKEGLSEYFLYTIEGTETIADKWGKRLPSFEANNIDVNSLYKYDESRWGEETIRFISFVNDEKHNLGKTPIPNGNVKVYATADSEGYLSYIGGMDVKYIPVGNEVELELGPDRLVSIVPTLMSFKTENYRYDGHKNIAGWDEVRQWQIEVTNTRKLPADIEIIRSFDTNYWTTQYDDNSIAYDKYDMTKARFKLKLEPKGKKIFTYTVTTYHGKRQEDINQ